MPLSKPHKQNSKEKILESAITLFTQKGFNKVSIDEIMQKNGMTRGAFYTHFESKEVLYAETVKAAAERSMLVKAMKTTSPKSDILEKLIKNYLSSQHLIGKMPPCPLAFLATDVANGEAQVRQAYTQVYKGFVKWRIRISPRRKQCLLQR